MFEEIELKLAVEADVVQAVLAHPVLQVPGRRSLLDAFYFDTPTQLLRRNAMALRLRRVGRQWCQTLKMDGDGAGALSSRVEWESPVRSATARPRIDLKLLSASPLPQLLSDHPEERSLVAVFRTRYTRTTKTLHFRRSVIEFALDVGAITQPARKTVSRPIHEIELELKSGRPRDLIDLALTLTGNGSASIALIGLASSKAERGYRLLEGKKSRVAKASASAITKSLDVDMRAATALREICRKALEVVLINAETLRERYEPECVHQARVALRRLRSALRLLDRKQEHFPKTLVTELRWLARALGQARDWDVITLGTLPPLVANSNAEIPPALLDRAAERRQGARERLLAQLAGARFARAVLRLQRWILSETDGGKSLKAMARPALSRAHRRLFNAARFFAALSGERRHRVRIFAKRLRYSLDILALGLPEQSAAHYSEQLSQLQDALGEINDLEVLAATLSKLSRSPNEFTLLRQRLLDQIEARLIPAERHLAALATRLPWDQPPPVESV